MTSKPDILNFSSRFIIDADGGPPIISGPPFGIMNIRIATVSAETVKRIIDKTLAEIECLKINSYNPSGWSYEIEYGTKPIWETLPGVSRRHLLKKAYCAIDASVKALKWFPHNEPPETTDDEEYGYELARIRSGIFEKRKWSENDIHIYRFRPSDNQEEIILNFQRNGDRASAWYIFNSLKIAFSSKNLCWETRKHYVELQESCANESHITKYVFDDNICKEICSYIS